MRAITPGRMFSITTSPQVATSRRASSTPSRVLEIEGDAELGVVEVREAAAAVDPGLAVLVRRVLHAKAVGPGARLDVHHGRAEVGQHLADVRPGRVAAELDDADTVSACDALMAPSRAAGRAAVDDERQACRRDAKRRMAHPAVRAAARPPESARLELRIGRDVGDGGDRVAEHLAPVRPLEELALGERSRRSAAIGASSASTSACVARVGSQRAQSMDASGPSAAPRSRIHATSCSLVRRPAAPPYRMKFR